MNRQILPVTIVTVIFFSLLYFSYKIIEKETINKNIINLKILSMQGAAGIENLFRSYLAALEFLAKTEPVKKNDSEGRKLIDAFYETHKDDITSVTRIDSYGRIIYSAPYNKNIIGVNISNQPHNREMNTKLIPVISDIFTSVQGYRALAIHVPVFEKKNYKGRISILIKFDKIAETYLKNVKIGESGTSWIITGNGIILYHPDRSLIDENADVYSNKIPSLKGAISDMKAGNEGNAWFYENNKKIMAYYYPVKLLSTHWSIVITSPENEFLGTAAEFRNLLFPLISLFFIFSITYIFYMVKTHSTIITGKNKLSEANKELSDACEKIKNLNSLIPICTSCKRIRNDDGYWSTVEIYLNKLSGAELTHSLCPDCLKKLYPDSQKK